MSNHGPTSISVGWWDFFPVQSYALGISFIQDSKTEHQTVNFLHSEHETRQWYVFFSIILNFGWKKIPHYIFAAEAMSASFHLMVPLQANGGDKGLSGHDDRDDTHDFASI